MRTFFIFGKSSSKELKEISLKYKADVLGLLKDFGGDVRSMYVMLREKYLVFILAFPGVREAMDASTALSKLTGILFQALPAIGADEFTKIIT